MLTLDRDEHAKCVQAVIKVLTPTLTDPALLKEEHQETLAAVEALQRLQGMLRRPGALVERARRVSES
jgi:hypothetical protein